MLNMSIIQNKIDPIKDIEKIKTSGDAYMCVGGIPIRNQTNPVDCVLAAFQFQKYLLQNLYQR